MGLFSKIVNKNNDELSDGIENVEVPSIVIDQNNVLEKMQNDFLEEINEQGNNSVEEDPTSIFNGGVSLNEDNPMAIFGVDNKE